MAAVLTEANQLAEQLRGGANALKLNARSAEPLAERAPYRTGKAHLVVVAVGELGMEAEKAAKTPAPILRNFAQRKRKEAEPEPILPRGWRKFNLARMRVVHKETFMSSGEGLTLKATMAELHSYNKDSIGHRLRS